MIYAIPQSRECVANHFMKAQQFAFLDDNHACIRNESSPAASKNSSCSDKKDTINLIKSMKADAVIVRNIGERSLNKLLNLGIRVFQVSCQTAVSEVLKSSMIELTAPTQGRPSKNHLKKGGCSGHSGSGCGHHDKSNDHHKTANWSGRDKTTFTQLSSITSIRPINKS